MAIAKLNLRRIRVKKPKQVIIEVTQRCNLKCKYCPSLTCDSSTDMPLEKFKEIVDKIDDPAATVIPWMNGEPMLHPDYHKMLEYLGEKGFRAYITTNGTIYRPEVAEVIKTYPSIYQVIISLDGLKYETIEKTRPGSSPHIIIDSIMQYAKTLKGSGTDVAVKICERGQDWEEIERFLKQWLFNVDFVIVGKRLGQINDVGMRQYPCQYFDNNFIVIRADGTLVPCAYHDEMINKNAWPLGNIDDFDTTTKAYNNPRYKKLRQLQDDKAFPSPCDKCSFAYTGASFHGIVDLEAPYLGKVYMHQDYYNQFFSLTQKEKPQSYYGHQEYSFNSR